MSLFILVERFGAPKRLLRSRSLAAHIGEDRAGLLARENPVRTYFSVYSFGERYYCRIEDPDFRLRGGATQGRAEGWLSEGDVITGLDYSFTFYVSSSRAEMAARLRSMPAEDIAGALYETDAPQLKVLMAGLWRSFPLLRDCEISLGSNPDIAVFVDAHDVAPAHCTFRYSKSSVEIRPLEGGLTLDGKVIAGACSISSSGTIMLEPSGLKLEIEFQQPCTR